MVHPRIRAVEPIQLPPEVSDGVPTFLLRDSAGLTTDQVLVTLPGLYLVELADGTRSLVEIGERMLELTGIQMDLSQIGGLFSSLDEKYLLDNDRARKRLEELSPRPARHAETGYPANPADLEPFLDQILGQAHVNESAFVRASVLPHIDFFRGKESYREGYRHLQGLARATETPLTVVILGISHAFCRTPFILTRKDFDTPLGVVETDVDLVEELAVDLPFDPFLDEYNHMGEHSVEFHAVLLKRLVAGRRPLKIVPILCRSFFEAILGKFSPLELPGVAAFLGNLAHLRDSRPEVHFLASVDLAHLGVNFGGDPLSKDFLVELERRDRESIEGLEQGQADLFFSTQQADGGERNYCGTPAIYSLLHLFPHSFKLHKYQQCTDPDFGSTVTICSATLRTRPKIE